MEEYDTMANIGFEKFDIENTFLDPRRNFQPTVVKSEVRIDPLTGRTGHFAHFGAVKPQQLDLEKYLEPQGKGFCPFCSTRREALTPKFPGDVIPEGRLARGEALLVPNLHPYDVYSSVCIMTHGHVVPLAQFSYDQLFDSFNLGLDFLKRVKDVDPSLPYHIMGWNYMPPSGGGLVHPHQQYFATGNPGNRFTDELKASEQFYESCQRDYWSELVSIEQKNDKRYIGQLGDSHWMTSYVSLGMLGEILCVFPGVYSIDDFTTANVRELVDGLQKVFSYFGKAGIYSFNASLLFGSVGQRFFSVHFRIVPRTFLNIRDYAPDMNFFQVVLEEPISVVWPEDVCREVKSFF
jgi:UDPglucose--hexose-1-phosphate uridylyltransferase